MPAYNVEVSVYKVQLPAFKDKVTTCNDEISSSYNYHPVEAFHVDLFN